MKLWGKVVTCVGKKAADSSLVWTSGPHNQGLRVFYHLWAVICLKLGVLFTMFFDFVFSFFFSFLSMFFDFVLRENKVIKHKKKREKNEKTK